MAHKQLYAQMEFTWWGPSSWRDLAEKVVGRLIDRNAWRFRKFHQVDEDDIKAEAVQAAVLAYGKFNPKKSAPSTFIHMVALRRLLTIQRTYNCRKVKDEMQREKECAKEVTFNQNIPAVQDRGDITSATTTQICDFGKRWTPGEWAGFYLAVQVDENATLLTIKGNSKNQLFFDATASPPDGVYCIVNRD